MPFLMDYITNDNSHGHPEAAAQRNASLPAAGSGHSRSPEVEKMAKAIWQWASTDPRRTMFALPAADEATAVPCSLPHASKLSPDEVVPRLDFPASATDPHQFFPDAEVTYMDNQRAAVAAVPEPPE